VEELEDQLFGTVPRGLQVQRRSFQLRKSLVLLRRLVIPMREVVNDVMRRDLRVVGENLAPYYQDVYDHVLRAAEWTDSLRDLVNSILETNLVIQGNRLNIITKKVTGWAAIIAVPTLITGYFGMNVPYPGFSESGLRRLRRHYRPGRPGALRHLQAQGLAVRPRILLKLRARRLEGPILGA
jgi:magnesium transporter